MTYSSFDQKCGIIWRNQSMADRRAADTAAASVDARMGMVCARRSSLSRRSAMALKNRSAFRRPAVATKASIDTRNSTISADAGGIVGSSGSWLGLVRPTFASCGKDASLGGNYRTAGGAMSIICYRSLANAYQRYQAVRANFQHTAPLHNQSARNPSLARQITRLPRGGRLLALRQPSASHFLQHRPCKGSLLLSGPVKAVLFKSHTTNHPAYQPAKVGVCALHHLSACRVHEQQHG